MLSIVVDQLECNQRLELKQDTNHEILSLRDDAFKEFECEERLELH